VQISATPKVNRSTNVFAQSRSPVFPGYDEEAEVNAAPSSSFSIVPQSVSRPSRENLQTKNPLFSSIQATPSRKTISNSSSLNGSFLAVSNSELPCFPPSPLHIRRSSAKLFAVPDSVDKDLPTSWMSQGIQETPVKKRPDIKVLHSHPEPVSDGNKENVEVKTRSITEDGSDMNGAGQEVSIYTSLGWDDDIDELA
jgi:DNA replication regulator SLD3